ncbi:MAG: hypothetical protein K0S44_1878 [Bacteroidetes bacterium]|jgi:uncharacterized protein (UPF0212 family)|nr:hypothetical protein [Bacteroidota bacterium]
MIEVTTRVLPKDKGINLTRMAANKIVEKLQLQFIKEGVHEWSCPVHPDHVSRIILVAQENDRAIFTIEKENFCCQSFSERTKLTLT